MPMPTIKEIEKAVQVIKEHHSCLGVYQTEGKMAEQTMIDLAESVLTAEWPEKKEVTGEECYCHSNDSGYFQCNVCRAKEDNSLIDLCLAAHLKQTAELREALVFAKSLIRTWANINLPEGTEKRAWEVYQNSPEMQRINKALGEDPKC
ncbi:MAG: hypothetical protein A4E53_01699 [Pelotomaculum sp. PtaB.Bin104]|jgi:hypothetical protein|nr:MAG: hypothetical protein A4E53_01699 [Pelotomaculum sp. PtaB.Bin104]